MELPSDVRTQLNELDNGADSSRADIRFLGNNGLGEPVWGCGFWQNVHHGLRDEAGKVLAKTNDPVKRSLLLNIIEGWKLAFPITGRMPGSNDVKRLAERDWRFRYERKMMNEKIDSFIDGPSEEEISENLQKGFREILDSDWIYKFAVMGRHSVVNMGVNNG